MAYEPHRITFIIKPDWVTERKVIPYLDDSIKSMRDLIESIIAKRSLVKKSII